MTPDMTRAMTPAFPTTFVTCIEAGILEQQVVLLARSLRALPSPLARCPMLAIQPRRGTALSRHTRQALAALEVELVSEVLVSAHDWNPHLNKAAAMRWSEGRAMTPFLTWLDGDMVLLRDLQGLIPPEGTSFMAMPANIDQGTDGKDGNAAYWDRVGAVVGLPYLPAALVPSVPSLRMIYEYYHGGIYTLRRDEGISDRHYAFFLQMLEARIASVSCGIYHHDQVSLSMAARTARGARACYPQEMNFSISPRHLDQIDKAMLGRAMVLHYHNCLAEGPYGQMAEVWAALPETPRNLIAAAAPIRLNLPPLRKLQRKVIGALRAKAQQRHLAACARI